MNTLYMKSSIGDYFFDVVFEEDYTFKNVITKNPVQQGANVNDHVYSEPATVIFKIGMSDVLQDIKQGQFSGGTSRSAEAFNILRTIWSSALTFHVYYALNGQLFDLPNMLIETFAPVKDKTTMNAFKATITMQQINVVNTQTIAVAESSEPQKTGTTEGGSETATVVTSSSDGLGTKIYEKIHGTPGFVRAGGG